MWLLIAGKDGFLRDELWLKAVSWKFLQPTDWWRNFGVKILPASTVCLNKWERDESNNFQITVDLVLCAKDSLCLSLKGLFHSLSTCILLQIFLKVSKYRKQFLEKSIFPKNRWKSFYRFSFFSGKNWKFQKLLSSFNGLYSN